MRLIDADALYESFERTPWMDNADRDIAEELLDNAPTVSDLALLLGEVNRLTAERDAAARDLRRDCTTCEHKGKSGLSEPCLNCQGANYANWEWRGGPADEADRT